MKYFTLEELTRSNTATQLNIDNTPSFEDKYYMVALIDHILDPLREAYGEPISVTSGYRSKKLNNAIGGAATSQHMKGQAADIVPSRAKTKEEIKAGCKKIFELAQELKLPFDQLIDESDFSWVHISFKLPIETNRGQVLRL